MSNPLEERVWKALKTVRYPGMRRDIVSFGFVRSVEVSAAGVTIGLELSTRDQQAATETREQVQRVVGELPGVERVEVSLNVAKPPPRPAPPLARDQSLIPGVATVIAIASGKGGVGKSTVATNLAVRFAQLGRKTGLLDADIYGPSVPMMLGVSGRPELRGQQIVPFTRHGVKLMSLGFLVDIDEPVIWRGPMIVKAIEQMLGQVAWGELDVLIVDLPPGTGDAQLTLTQKVPISAGVIVTTPQDVSLIDARKGLAMFRKLNTPVAGIVENMSGFECPHCGETTDVFKTGGGERTAATLGCRFLGRIPLDARIVAGGDAGEPIVASRPDGDHAARFGAVVEAVEAEVSATAIPQVKIS